MKIISKISAIIGIIVLLVAIIIPIVDNANYDSKTINVLVIDGQSNAEYGDTFVCDPAIVNEEYPIIPKNKLYYFGTSNAPANEWDWSHMYQKSWAAFHIHSMYDNEWRIGGYEPILGNTISEKTGNDTLVVNMGAGARKINDLLPEGKDGYYSWGILDRALNQIKSMGYHNINMIGVIWIQGESDIDTPVQNYINDFNILEDSFNSYGLDKFYIVHTRDYFGGNANIAQEQICNTNPNVIMATYITDTFTQANGMLASNADIHYSQKGRDAICFAIKDKITIPNMPGSIDYAKLLSIIPIVIIVAVIVYCIPPFNNRLE